MQKFNVIASLIMVVLLGFAATSLAGEASVFNPSEGWIIRSCSEGAAPPYTVWFEVVDSSNAIVPAANIAGLADSGQNATIISNSATIPDISLSFDPATSTAYLFYTDADAGGLQLKVIPNLFKVGPRISVNPNPLSFGNVNVNSTSYNELVVSNVGNANLKLGTISVTGTGFVRNGGTCTETTILTQGTNCTVGVNFTPTSPVSITAVAGNYLSVASNDHDVNVPLTGVGVAVVNNVDIAITNVIVSSTINNGQRFPVTVTVTNNGTSPSGPFNVKGWFSTDKIGGNPSVPTDKLLFTWAVDGLNPGQSLTNIINNNIFQWFPIHSTSNVVVTADTVAGETNTTNNTVAKQVSVAR